MGLATNASSRTLQGTGRETVGWLMREMNHPAGGVQRFARRRFGKARKASSVWSLAQITDVLGQDDAAVFAAHYDVTPDGIRGSQYPQFASTTCRATMEDEPRLHRCAKAAFTRTGIDQAAIIKPFQSARILSFESGPNPPVRVESSFWRSGASRGSFLHVARQVVEAMRIL